MSIEKIFNINRFLIENDFVGHNTDKSLKRITASAGLAIADERVAGKSSFDFNFTLQRRRRSGIKKWDVRGKARAFHMGSRPPPRPAFRAFSCGSSISRTVTTSKGFAHPQCLICDGAMSCARVPFLGF